MCCNEDDTGCCTSEDSNCTFDAVYMCKNVNGMYDKISIPCNIDNRTCPGKYYTCTITILEGHQHIMNNRRYETNVNETAIQKQC